MKNKDKTDVRTVTFARRDIKSTDIVLYKPNKQKVARWESSSVSQYYHSPEQNHDGTMTMTEEQVY